MRDVPEIRSDGLQLQEHPHFQRLFWVAERCAWALFAAALLMAICGFTGAGGIFATSEVTSDTGRAEVPRVSRWLASDELRIEFLTSKRTHRLGVGRSFLDHFQIERLEPEPRESVMTGEGHEFVFDATDDGNTRVIVHVRPSNPGIVSYSLEMDGASATAATVVAP